MVKLASKSMLYWVKYFLQLHQLKNECEVFYYFINQKNKAKAYLKAIGYVYKMYFYKLVLRLVSMLINFYACQPVVLRRCFYDNFDEIFYK